MSAVVTPVVIQVVVDVAPSQNGNIVMLMIVVLLIIVAVIVRFMEVLTAMEIGITNINMNSVQLRIRARIPNIYNLGYVLILAVLKAVIIKSAVSQMGAVVPV